MVQQDPHPVHVMQQCLQSHACSAAAQGEMINDSGTMTGGGGKPRGGRLRLGSGAPKPVNQRAAAAELDAAQTQEHASVQVPPFHPAALPREGNLLSGLSLHITGSRLCGSSPWHTGLDWAHAGSHRQTQWD